MQRTPGSKSDRTFNWVVAAVLGLPGFYDAVTGTFASNAGVALYGLGKVLCALFFVLHALNPEGLQIRAKWAVRLLLVIGVAVGILGFCIKKGYL
jgi:hypothetical protein